MTLSWATPAIANPSSHNYSEWNNLGLTGNGTFSNPLTLTSVSTLENIGGLAGVIINQAGTIKYSWNSLVINSSPSDRFYVIHGNSFIAFTELAYDDSINVNNSIPIISGQVFGFGFDNPGLTFSNFKIWFESSAPNIPDITINISLGIKKVQDVVLIK